VHHDPLFSDTYIESLQSGRGNSYQAIQALWSRIRTLSAARQFDAYWVEKDALPWMPALIETNLIPRDAPLVVDYDDAVFHHYDLYPNFLLRYLIGRKHQVLMRKAALVVAGNQYIADYALRAGAHRVEILPTVIDLKRYKPVFVKSYETTHAVPTVGWIGQRSTAGFLYPLAPLFSRLSDSGLMKFRAIGIDAATLGLPMDSDEWGEQTEVASIQKMDVGIMPLDDGPFQRGKCGYKLIQYMACGLPVVASPVGVNTTIVEHGVDGFLANSLGEWEWALRTLAKDPILRHRMGQAGRVKVEREYCLQLTAPILAGWLAEVASGRRV
jgi:glycosyltransferase involved in cell wall biosynthesis